MSTILSFGIPWIIRISGFVLFKFIESSGSFVKSIENTFVKQLTDLEQTKRPVHCTDKKRKTVYIKKTNKWEKDDEHAQLQQALKDMNMKQIRALTSHYKENPDWTKQDKNLDNSNKIVQKICDYNADTESDINKKVINVITTKININK